MQKGNMLMWVLDINCESGEGSFALGDLPHFCSPNIFKEMDITVNTLREREKNKSAKPTLSLIKD